MASAALAWAFGQPMLRDREPVLVYRAAIQAFVDAHVAAHERSCLQELLQVAEFLERELLN